MRIKLFAPLLAALTMFLFPAGSAQAGKIPIPCTGEKIVLVQEMTKGAQGESTGLGYLYQGCFSGKWIMHTGSSSSYRDGGELVLQLAKSLTGSDIAEPSLWFGMRTAPGQFWGEWMWVVVIGIMGVAILFRKPQDNAAETGAPAAMAPAAPQGQRMMAQPRGFGRRA